MDAIQNHPSKTLLFRPKLLIRRWGNEGAQLDRSQERALPRPKAPALLHTCRSWTKSADEIISLLPTDPLLAHGVWSATTPARTRVSTPNAYPCPRCTALKLHCGKVCTWKQAHENHLWQPEVIYDFFLQNQGKLIVSAEGKKYFIVYT